MDYRININGIDVVIEKHEPENRASSDYMQRKRLCAYYKQLLLLKGVGDDPQKLKALDELIDNMTEQSAKKKADDFEKNRYKRIIAYALRFMELKLKAENPEMSEDITQEEVGQMKKMADALIEVLDASIEDNNENMETVEINGNKFVYEKGTLNIRDYVLKLYDIGEQNKGNTWTIYVDDEGELVIY